MDLTLFFTGGFIGRSCSIASAWTLPQPLSDSHTLVERDSACTTLGGSEEHPADRSIFWRLRFLDSREGLWSTASRAKAFLEDCSPRGARGILRGETMMIMMAKTTRYSVKIHVQ